MGNLEQVSSRGVARVGELPFRPETSFLHINAVWTGSKRSYIKQIFYLNDKVPFVTGRS